MFWQILINNALICSRIKVRKNKKRKRLIVDNFRCFASSFLVNINYLLKQPVFRTAEDILKNYSRSINIRFESGNSE